MEPREFAERALLGTLMLDHTPINSIQEWLEPEDFRTPLNASIYRHIRDLAADTTAGFSPQVLAERTYHRVVADGEYGAPERVGPYLHTLMATAPVAAQAKAYAAIVLEASIRRSIAAAGMRVEQHAASGPELGRMLAAVDETVHDLLEVQQRWERMAGGSVASRLQAGTDTTVPAVDGSRVALAGFDTDLPIPSEEQAARAELNVLAAVISQPSALERLIDRLHAEDFADEAVANSYRAAVALYGEGVRPDPVTVAWQQGRQLADYGEGLSSDVLLRLSQDSPGGDARYEAEVVMRARLARLTASAADAAQQVSRNMGVRPGDVLHTGQLAYAAVSAVANRMADTGPRVDRALQPLPAAAGRSVRELDGMRARSRGLLTLVEGSTVDLGGADAGSPNAPGDVDAGRPARRDITRRLDPEPTPNSQGPDLA
jgi:replicative DNA helicase